MTPNMMFAERFIKALAGDSPVTFQTFDDNPDRNDATLNRVLHGTLAEHAPVLIELNHKGAGVFMMVNEGDGKGRKTRNVRRVRALFVDLDEDGVNKLQVILALSGPGQPHIITQTSPERFHVYWLIAGDLPLDKFRILQMIFAERFGGDPKVIDLPRVMRIPGFYHRKHEPVLVTIMHEFESIPLPAGELAKIADHKTLNVPKQRDVPALPVTINLEELREALQHIDAEDYDIWLRVGMALHREMDDAGLSLWIEWSARASNFNEGECEEKWSSFGKRIDGPVVSLGTVYHLAREGGWQRVPSRENYTDKGNSYRLVRFFGYFIRYVPEFKKWLVWDGTRWLLDELGQIQQYAKQTTAQIIHEAQGLQDEQRQRLMKHAIASESYSRLIAMIELAKTEPGIATNACQFDGNKYLLNVLNGTINLKTATLQPHNRDDLITQRVDIEFILGKYTCPTWETFLQRTMDGNQDLILFLQKAVGYSLTADTSEQCLFFLYGMGANGKSTFLSILEALLHDFALHLAPETLMIKKNNDNAATPELARLRGARVVITSEVEEGLRLSETTVKLLTGDQRVAVRFLYGQPFDLEIEFKIWIAGNHQPVIRGTDDAIWRRILLVPFTVTIPEDQRDKHLLEKLQQELPGILHWALDGCSMWQKEGLQPPETIRAATRRYREDMDTIGQWLEECCEGEEGVITTVKSLYSSYSEWCRECGHATMSSNRLGRVLTERGYRADKNPQAIRIGIRLKRPVYSALTI